VRPRGRAPLGKVWHTWDGWIDSPESAPPPAGTEQRAGARRSSSAAEVGVESVVEAIKTQTDAIAALAAAVEKMSRTVSNFVFAQRGSRKQSGNQGQSEVREKKKKAEKKKNAGVTSVAAAKSAGADAEDAEGANAEDMAEVAEEKKNAGKKEEREKKGREEAEKKKNAGATNIAATENAEADAEDATSDAEISDADAGDAAGSAVWKCVGDVSSNSSRWQEDASETAAMIAEAVVRHRLQRQGERDDMLCSVMEDAVEEMPVAEAVSYAAAIAAVTVLAIAMMAVTAKVSEAEEAAAAAVKAAEAVEAAAAATTVMAAQAVEVEAAAVKQQEWEQRCAEHVEMLARQDCNKREEWWAVCSAERDERISRLETICAKQAHATMEMFKMQNEMAKAQ